MEKRAMQEARGILAVLGAAAVGSLLTRRLRLAALFSGLIGWTVFFFRDPRREPPVEATLILAPADGRIVDVVKVEETEFFPKKSLRISIFLSIFDVHVNRSPIAGRIVSSIEKRGRYLDARNPLCSSLNASRLWVIENESCRVAVRQITGAIARRICAWKAAGDLVAQGERFGMIRFGSRTELYVPLGSELLVRLGDYVQAGLTPLARLAKVDRDDETYG